jgi:hypothetical protein
LVRAQCRQTPVVSRVTTTIVEMDPASKALAEAPPNDSTTWAALADASGVALTTLYNRYHGRPPKEEVVQHQQYLSVEEEKALVAFVLRMGVFGTLIRVKYIPALAFASLADVPRTDPPNHRTRIGLRPSVAATHNSNRGIIGLCRGSVTIIAYMTRWYIGSM